MLHGLMAMVCCVYWKRGRYKMSVVCPCMRWQSACGCTRAGCVFSVLCLGLVFGFAVTLTGTKSLSSGGFGLHSWSLLDYRSVLL